MVKKIEILRKYLLNNQYSKALKLAASWPKLGGEKDTIQKAWAAHSNPSFYRQLNYTPELLVKQGIEALRKKYLSHLP